MATWTPTRTVNGWWPRLSPDGLRVLYGAGGEAWVAVWRAGFEQPITEGPNRVYPMGWLNGHALCAIVPPRPQEEPIAIDGGAYPSVNRVDARGGSWCAGRAADGYRVWFNGTEILGLRGWDSACDGPVLTVQTHAGLDIYRDGVRVSTIPCGEVRSHRLRGSCVGFSQGARAWILELGLNEQPTDVTVSPSGRESCPVVVHGWVWSVTEVGGLTYVQGHPLGETRVLVRARPSGSQDWIDVVHIEGAWIVASCHDRGVLVVEDIPDAEALRPWDEILADLPMSPVVVPPAPAHLTGCGYFFRDTNVHAYLKKYGDENPEAPGTHSVIIDDHGMPAETRANGTTPRMIVGLGQLLHAQLPGWWDQVDAVYVAVENDPVALTSSVGLAKYLMSWRKLSPRPVLTYSGATIDPATIGPHDILGVQLYAEPGRDPVANIQAQAAVYAPQIRGVRRVAVIGQAYDRGGLFTGAQIAALQPVLYDIACGWPNCEYLLWFSDSRKGGTRDYEPEVRPWHTAIAQAITAGGR